MPLPRSTGSCNNPIPVIPYRDCAAKNTPDGGVGTSVVDHCVNAGRVSEALFSLLPEVVRKCLPPAPGLSVSLHDVGKVSPGYELKNLPRP
jgi:hypothetical protein